MKTERRHELQTNVLADHLGKWIVTMKPYATMIIIALIAVVVMVATWQITGWVSGSGRGAAWDEFEAARQKLVAADDASSRSSATIDNSDDPAMKEAIDAIDRVIEKHEGQPVEYWGELLLGNHFQNVGTKLLFHDREKAVDQLKRAADYFRKATESEQPDLKQRAYFGLGQALECQGEIDRAIQAYAALEKEAPNGPLTSTARTYADRLEKPETREFYANYFKQNPDADRKKQEKKPGSEPDPFGRAGFGGAGPRNPLDAGSFLLPNFDAPQVDVPKVDPKDTPKDGGTGDTLPLDAVDGPPKPQAR